MSKEWLHQEIEQLTDTEQGETYYNEKIEYLEKLLELTKHISPDGEEFAPPAVSTEEGSVGDNPDQRATLSIRTREDGRALALQNSDDTVNNGVGRANIIWVSDSNEMMSAITSHPTGEHFSLYGRDAPLGEDATIRKVLDIDWGGGDERVTWHGMDEFSMAGGFVNYVGRLRILGGIWTARTESELDEVLNSVDSGDIIYLGNTTFSQDRTISTQQLTFVGTMGSLIGQGQSTTITADWTFEGQACSLRQVGSSPSNTITFTGQRSSVDTFAYGNIVFEGDSSTANNLRNVTVSYASGTSGGTVGVRTSDVTVNDPDGGNNVIPLN